MSESKSTTEEIWKEIPGFEGYEVSNLGRVRSYWKLEGNRGGVGTKSVLSHEWHILKGKLQDGYPSVVLRQQGCDRAKRKWQRIHVLVLTTFVGPRPPGCDSRHFPDATRTNCRLDNLSWCTRSQNTIDVLHHHKRPNIHLVPEDIPLIRKRIYLGESDRSIAIDYKVKTQTITEIRLRYSWSHITDSYKP